VNLRWFTTRRRTPLSCSCCGTRLHRVLPALPYYTIEFLTALMVEVAMLPVLLCLFMKRWDWIALIVAAVLAVNLLVSAFLNSRARLEFADPADARQDKPGRWYPR
jgi:hypothetical protein